MKPAGNTISAENRHETDPDVRGSDSLVSVCGVRQVEARQPQTCGKNQGQKQNENQTVHSHAPMGPHKQYLLAEHEKAYDHGGRDPERSLTRAVVELTKERVVARAKGGGNLRRHRRPYRIDELQAYPRHSP